MKKILFVILLTPIFSMTCYDKEGPNCHLKITYKNHSDFTILKAELYKDAQKGCRFAFREFKPGEEIVANFGRCWENSLPEEVYILSPEKVEKMHQDNYYNCDSIGIKNKILKHYVLTEDYLRERNWTVTYPE